MPDVDLVALILMALRPARFADAYSQGTREVFMPRLECLAKWVSKRASASFCDMQDILFTSICSPPLS